MLAVAEAQARIWAAFTATPPEWVVLDQALGRVLAVDLRATGDQPPAAVSAMDGYAVRAADTADTSRRLQVVAEIAAGSVWPGQLQPGTAARIFTGGVVPDGADAILIQENASVEPEGLRPLEPVGAGRHIRARGLDFTAGWVGVEAGRDLDPLAVGLAASMGHVWLPVRRRPRIGLLATGDELRRPGAAPQPGSIVSCNTTALAAMIRLWGGEPVDLGISVDQRGPLLAAVDSAAGLDALVTTGGASVGDYDLIQPVLRERGLELDFWKIAMRPGKPLIFGRLAGMPVIGLPGNPVSAAVCAIVFLRGAVRRCLGRNPDLPVSDAILTGPLAANDQRQDYLRATLERRPGEPDRVTPAPRQDSSMFAALANAGALVVRPPHAPPAQAGDLATTLRLHEIFYW